MTSVARAQSGQGTDGPHVSWFQIAIVAIVVAAGLAVSLVVVAALSGADTLSTVALALAVVAFTTQILVFVADTWTTTRLNAETHGLLRELRTRAQGTEKTLNKQVDKLTSHLLESVGNESKLQGDTPEEARQRLRQDVMDVLAETFPGQVPALTAESAEGEADEPSMTDEEARILEEFSTYPEEAEGKQLLAQMAALSPIALGTLKDFASDEWRNRLYGREPGMHLKADHPFTDELFSDGLVRRIPKDEEEEDGWDGWAALTDSGRTLSRLMMAPIHAEGPIPAWLLRQPEKEENG